MLRQQSQTNAPSPTTKLANQWVRLILPGHATESLRFDAPLGGLLSTATAGLLTETPIELVEWLTWAGRYQEEYLLTGWPAITTENQIDNHRLAESSDLFRSLRDSGANRSSALTATYLESNLMDRLGLDLVSVDMRPVGTTPPRTNRVVATTSNTISLDRQSTRSAFATHLYDLAQQGIPHLARTRIATTPDDAYLVEQQLARFEGTDQHLYSGTWSTALDSPPETGLRTAYGHSSVTSSRQRLAATDWSVRPAVKRGSPAHGAAPTAPPTADVDQEEELESTLHTICADEFAWLCGRETDPERIRSAYDRLGVIPTLKLDSESLTGILGLVPNYDAGPWLPENPLTRARPRVLPMETVHEASGTGHEAVTDTDRVHPAAPTTDRLAAVDQWSSAPDSLLRTAICGLREYGDSISVEGEGVPPEAAFVRTTPQGRSEPVIVGTEATLTAGDLIVAAERLGPNQGLTVVTDSEADAHWLFDVFRTPFRKLDTPTQLYHCSTRYWMVDDAVALLPADESVAWWLTPDNELVLTLNGESLATGSPRTLPPDPGAPLLRAVAEPPHYSVFHPERGLITTANSLETLLRDRSLRPIPLPAVPRTHYLNRVTVLVTENEQLRCHTPKLPTTPSNRRWPCDALRDFIRHQTCPADRDHLTAADIRPAFRRYLRSQTNRWLPPEKRITDALRELLGLDTTQRSLSIGQDDGPTLSGRTWRYPERRTSAVLPQSSDTESSSLAVRLETALSQ